VLGLTRAGACGNGVCEAGETCSGPAEAATSPGAAAAAAAVAQSTSFSSWIASLNAAAAAVATGAGFEGPAAVGLYKLTSVDPELESTWFHNPRTGARKRLVSQRLNRSLKAPGPLRA
jgi:hypothetical protein